MTPEEPVDNSQEPAPRELRGRPPREKRAPLGLKIDAAVKDRIDVESRAAGISQSRYVERLIEMAYRYELALGEFDEWKRGLVARMAAIENNELLRVLAVRGWTKLYDPKHGISWRPPQEGLSLPTSGFVAEDAPQTTAAEPQAAAVTGLQETAAALKAAHQKGAFDSPRLVETLLELLQLALAERGPRR